MNVLYVEDNKINAIVMDRMLSKDTSNTVIIAQNAIQALKLVTRQPILDLILVDINLGVDQMDGCELLQKLRRLDITTGIPVFAVTAYAMPGDAKRFKKVGFDQYFAKPVNFEKLFQSIDKIKLKK